MSQHDLKRQIRKLVADREHLNDLSTAYDNVICDLRYHGLQNTADGLEDLRDGLPKRRDRINDEISALRATVRGTWAPRWLW